MAHDQYREENVPRGTSIGILSGQSGTVTSWGFWLCRAPQISLFDLRDHVMKNGIGTLTNYHGASGGETITLWVNESSAERGTEGGAEPEQRSRPERTATADLQRTANDSCPRRMNA